SELSLCGTERGAPALLDLEWHGALRDLTARSGRRFHAKHVHASLQTLQRYFGPEAVRRDPIARVGREAVADLEHGPAIGRVLHAREHRNRMRLTARVVVD